MNLFNELLKVKTFEFKAQAGENSQTGWNGYGRGSIELQEDSDTIYFKEDGKLKLDCSKSEVKIANEYVWQKINSKEISLSHARFGHSNLVKLFDLVQIDQTHWQSKQAHVCVDDLYSAELEILDTHIELVWKITGPKKDECIKYRYSP